MKRKILLIVLAIVFIAFSSYAFQPDVWLEKSAEKTADALILSGAGWFAGVAVETDGTNTCTFTVYDNTSGSGTKLITDALINTGSTNKFATFGVDPMVLANTGIYVDITTEGTCT